MPLSHLITPKEKIGFFEIQRVLPLPELQCTLVEAKHLVCGAEVIHLSCDDDENLFCLSLKTLPNKPNGVAHILEHAVLCGSQKYPVRDLFFGMTRRSLNTFMNALTGSDFTCYPASSCVENDFYNLLEVYLDAVFHPLLLKSHLLQEGWRLEYAQYNDISSPLMYKGVVFNEMKGAMNNPDSRLMEALMSSLFPDLTYAINSGGNPKDIPTLTYEELKNFHKTYYHPSRCLFYFYGNLPLEKHLRFLEENALKGVSQVDPIPPIPKQRRFTQPIRKKASYPISPQESLLEKALIACSWLTTSILNQEEVLALAVLDLVLMGTDAAPLKKALLRSQLCKTVDSFMESEISEIPFTFVFRGCLDENGEVIETLLRNTLKQIVKEGLPTHLVEGALHQLEFSRCEITGNSSPFGLSLFMRSGLLKQHGGKSEEGLLVHSLFEKLRQNVQDPTYLPHFIEKYFLTNPHFVRIDLIPDETLSAKEGEEERESLDTINKNLTLEEKEALVEQAEKLIRLQEDPSLYNIDLLPKVTLEDVPKKAKEISLEHHIHDNLEIFHHCCFTNGIVYMAIVYDLPLMLEEELPYLRLFTLLFGQTGCKGRSYEDVLEETLMHTGGIKASLELFLQSNDPNQMKPCLILKGKALDKKVHHLFSLMIDLIEGIDFTDKERFEELLVQHLHELEESAHRGSLQYAINLGSSGLSIPSKILNIWNGLPYYLAVKDIVKEFYSDPTSLINKLEEIQKRILGLRGAHLILSSDSKSFDRLQSNAFFGLSKINHKSYVPWQTDYSLTPVVSQGRITASPVAHSVWIFEAPHYLHPASPGLYIASEIMESQTLHKRIREQGGAYGSGAAHSSLNGQFYFYAYRDPHIANSYIAIEEAIVSICEGNFSERELEEAKLSVIQELDSPTPPGSRALIEYGRWRTGRTLAQRQTFRNRVLAITKEEIITISKEHLIPGFKQAIFVTFANKELLEAENLLLREKALPLFPIEMQS